MSGIADYPRPSLPVAPDFVMLGMSDGRTVKITRDDLVSALSVLLSAQYIRGDGDAIYLMGKPIRGVGDPVSPNGAISLAYADGRYATPGNIADAFGGQTFETLPDGSGRWQRNSDGSGVNLDADGIAIDGRRIGLLGGAVRSVVAPAGGLVTTFAQVGSNGRTVTRWGPTHFGAAGLYIARLTNGDWTLAGPQGVLMRQTAAGKTTFQGLPISIGDLAGAVLALRGNNRRALLFKVDTVDGALRLIGRNPTQTDDKRLSFFQSNGPRMWLPGIAAAVPLSDGAGTFYGLPEQVDGVARWLVDKGVGLVRDQVPLAMGSSINSLVTTLSLRSVSMQSNAAGRGTSQVLTTVPPKPGYVVMWKPGVRSLGNDHSSAYSYTALDPMTLTAIVDAFETPGETGWVQMGKRISDARGTNTAVLVVTHAIGGRQYEDWGLPSTQIFKNVLISLRQAQLFAALNGMTIDADYHHGVGGETDETKSLATFYAQLVQYQADITAAFNTTIPGRTGDVVVVQSQMSSWEQGGGPVLSDVPLAQLKVAVDYPTKQVCIGPTYQFAYESDGLHTTGQSKFRLGEIHGWYEVQHKANGSALPLYAASATISGATITVTCNGLLGQLVVDTVLVSDPGRYGVEFGQTGGNNPSITSVTLQAPNQIVVKLTSTPTGTAQWVGFGLTGVLNALAGPTTGPRTCFRDSVAMLTSADGTSTPLYKHLCHGRIYLN